MLTVANNRWFCNKRYVLVASFENYHMALMEISCSQVKVTRLNIGQLA